MQTWLIRVHDGRISFGSEENKTRFKLYAGNHPNRTYRLEPIESLRSMRQHRYYWLYLGIVSLETGHTPEELHEWAKREFLPVRYATVLGKDVPVTASTTNLSKTDFGEYLEKICAETGVPLPDPQEAGYLPN